MTRIYGLHKLFIALVFALIGLVAYAFYPQSIDLSDFYKVVDNYTVCILRDTWGVPHIFGKNDTDASFGLAYAHT